MKLSDYRGPTLGRTTAKSGLVIAEDGRRKTVDKIRNGFTLVELLVVITIMALVGTYTLSNYGSFGEDQKLKNAVLDIQSQLRTAQTNATTNVKCGTQSSLSWVVEFTDVKTIKLICLEDPSWALSIKKTLTLEDPNIEIQCISGNIGNCSGLTFQTNTLTFAPLTGKIDLGGSYTLFNITLINKKTGITKSLVVEQGGRIYAQ